MSTTKFCKKCGEEKLLDQFYKDNGLKGGIKNTCKVCDAKQNKQWYIDKRDYNREKCRRWRSENQATVAIRWRQTRLKRKYGLTNLDYDEMLFAQGGGCAICGTADSKMSHSEFLSVDHCHTTGHVRALLCALCNAGIGAFGESVERLLQAAAYLRRHSEPRERKASKK